MHAHLAGPRQAAPDVVVRALAACALALLLVPALPAASAADGTPADGPVADEAQVRAAFLFNLARFVEWPPWAFESPADPIAICLVAGDPFGGGLDEVVRGRQVAGRRFQVRRGGETQTGPCHIIFVPASNTRRLADLLHGRARAPSLTVSDAPFFTDDGGMIGLYTESRRVRFEINVAAVEANGLRVSSRLVSLAARVTRVNGGHP